MNPLLTVNLMVAGYILLRSLGALNTMTAATNHGVRLAFLVTAIGAMAVVCGPMYGYNSPAWSEVVMNAGFAGYLFFCRRDCDRLRGVCQ